MLLLTEVTTGQAWESLKAVIFGKSGAMNRKVLSLTFKGYTYLPTKGKVTTAG
jgi:hypothetical protein